jgi:hypothetical protein
METNLRQRLRESRRKLLGIAAAVSLGIGVPAGILSIGPLNRYQRRDYVDLLIWQGRKLDISQATIELLE